MRRPLRLVNNALRRATGYGIAKAVPPRPRPDRIRRFHDDEAHATMTAVRDWTMTSHSRVFALIEAVRYVADQGIEGAMVECGVWRGGSMQAVARTLLDRGVRDRDLHLFDTFAGMPPPTEEDRRLGGLAARELLASNPRSSNIWAIADLEDVRAGMSRTGYPSERIHYHPGLVQDTVPAQAPERIALLRLDTDWYESTKHELTHLYDRVTPGAVIIIDDYDFWEGSRQAVDEFIAAGRHRLLLVPVDSARIVVKP
jgi:O-methyltransferase